MSGKKFKAMIVSETSSGSFVRELGQKSLDQLPDGEVLIRVDYSSLNYKDALSASGNKGVTRQYPHTPGIDAAGVVEESSHNDFRAGDPVLVTGYDLGMNTSGGFGQFIRVPADWVVRLPENLSARESMIYGTAGFTAALSVHKLENFGITPEQGKILVTGATGGVGSMALSFLAKDGYHVVAATGKESEKDFLTSLGAVEVIHRDETRDTPERPLLKGRWAGAVDTVGGEILAAAIKSTANHGAVTCCGNVLSGELHMTVYPFILRGVSLMGVDSANTPMDTRLKVWEKLAGRWKLESLEDISNEINLAELDQHIGLILQGKLKGRTVVRIAD
jgi:putative YhdH/YhfP family quinone oxidoreductase